MKTRLKKSDFLKKKLQTSEKPTFYKDKPKTVFAQEIAQKVGFLRRFLKLLTTLRPNLKKTV